MDKRDIKFRAWDEERKEMIYDFKSNDRSTPALDNNGVLVSSTWHTLMEFTGLCDKDGTAIYEGDILGGYPHGDARK